jgi:hypothetical protein
VPGAMGALVLLSVARPDLNILRVLSSADPLKEGTVGFVAALTLGGLYRILDVRAKLLGDFWRTINDNIKSRLLLALPVTERPGGNDVAALRAGRALMDVFYGILDNDETLKSRMAGVYFNGLLVTSSADLSVASAVGALAHAMLAILGRPNHLTWAVMLVVTFFFGRKVLMPRAIAKHRELSNEQLDFIGAHCSGRLRELVGEAVSRLPRPTP